MQNIRGRSPSDRVFVGGKFRRADSWYVLGWMIQYVLRRTLAPALWPYCAGGLPQAGTALYRSMFRIGMALFICASLALHVLILEHASAGKQLLVVLLISGALWMLSRRLLLAYAAISFVSDLAMMAATTWMSQSILTDRTPYAVYEASALILCLLSILARDVRGAKNGG